MEYVTYCTILYITYLSYLDTVKILIDFNQVPSVCVCVCVYFVYLFR